MSIFWQTTTHDWWRVITNHGDAFGETNFTENGASYVSDYCELSTVIEHDDTGVNNRVDTIKNTSNEPLHLNCLNVRFVLDGGEYEVYTQYNAWQSENLGAWQPLVTEIGASCDSFRTCLSSAPFMVVWNKQTNRGMVFHYLPDCAWKMSVLRTPLDGGGENSQIVVEMGPSCCGLDICLAPGESFKLPEVWYYETTNKLDMDAWRLHRYCHKRYPRRELPIIYNTWMCRFDNIDYDTVATQVALAAELGVEYFVIDAGWFGHGDGWSTSVGDWTENTTAKFAGRMAELAEYVRNKGMKFGLWFEPERVAKDSDTMREHPSYYLIGNVGFNFTDFANPEAREHTLNNVAATIEKYGVEFVKFDFNADLLFDKRRSSFFEYFKGYHAFLNALKQRFPTLYIENCASGGERLNLANIQEFDSFWYSDCQSAYIGMQMIKDGMKRMPPQLFDRWFVAQSAAVAGAGKVQDKLLACEDATWDHVASVQQSFMQAFMSAGAIGFSCDLSGLSEETFAWVKEYIANYKQERDYWKTVECRTLTDTGSMLVLQYNDADFNTVRVQAISSKTAQSRIRMYPQVPQDAMYQLKDGTTVSGKKLAEEGLTLIQSLDYRADNRRMQEIILTRC